MLKIVGDVYSKVSGQLSKTFYNAPLNCRKLKANTISYQMTRPTHCFQTRVKSHIQLNEKPSSGQGFEEREIAG
jgi:hypothetical protein